MTPASQVTQAIAAGYTPVAGGLAAIAGSRWEPEGEAPRELVHVVAGERAVQVEIDPATGAVRVFVDRHEVPYRRRPGSRRDFRRRS